MTTNTDNKKYKTADEQHFTELLDGGPRSIDNIAGMTLTAKANVTEAITFDVSDAAFHNSVGMYTYNDSGKVTNVQLIYANVSGAGVKDGPTDMEVTLKAGQHFGFFVASDAFSRAANVSHLLSGTGKFELLDGKTGDVANVNAGHAMKLAHVDDDGTVVKLSTKYGSVYSTNTNNNADKFQHTLMLVDHTTGKITLAMEDLKNGGDQNWLDANFSMTIAKTNILQLSKASKSAEIIGGAGDDKEIGRSGNDTITGGLGNNTLYGGMGDDVFFAAGGNDKIYGGFGFNSIDFTLGKSAVTVDLVKHSATGFGTDKLSNITGATGTSYGDRLKGDNAANKFEAGAGNDKINGGAGADTLSGGLGHDTFSWKLRDVVDSSWKSRGVDHVTDFEAGDDVLNFRMALSNAHSGHSSNVVLVDSAAGTNVRLTVDGHEFDVAMLDGVHKLVVADLLASHHLLV